MHELDRNDTEEVDGGAQCVILGSGFSRAISNAMPTMTELGVEVLAMLKLEPELLERFGGNLEQWMSFLSIDQPWLSAVRNLENRAMFAEVSNAVYHCINQDEARALADTPIPDWLLRLVWTWCDQEVKVFTFNYDTLLERAVSELDRLETFGDLYAMSLSDRLAAGDGAAYGASTPTGPLLSLHKLHGSTNWAFGGLDAPRNDRISLMSDRLRWASNGLDHSPGAPREVWKWDDVKPLIIPPTLTKGPYFANQSLRGQWFRAGRYLQSAERLSVIGYSFPSADLVAQQWVSTSFTRGTRMDVVDRATTRPAQIREGLSNPKPGEDFVGDDALERFVDSECGPLVRWSLTNSGDPLGPQVSLTVNGEDVLAPFRTREVPWGTDYLAAQRWLHERIEPDASGTILNGTAQGSMSGNQEDRWVVLPPGRTLTI